MTHNTNKDHGDGFEAGLQEHALFVDCTIEALKGSRKALVWFQSAGDDALPILEFLCSGELRLEDFLDYSEYLDGVLAQYPDRSSDWRVGFCVGFQSAHKNFLKSANWTRGRDGIYRERGVAKC